MPKACEPQRLRKPPNPVSEALPSLSDRTRTFWVRMEIIVSFQAFENLADRTFRGRSLGYQDEHEPRCSSNAWRMRRTVPWSAGRGHPSCDNRCATRRSYRPDARTMSAMAQSLPNRCITANCREGPTADIGGLLEIAPRCQSTMCLKTIGRRKSAQFTSGAPMR